MSVLFISDLHLEADGADKDRLFLDFLAQAAGRTETLYILGDLFEAWIGDDDSEPGIAPIVAALGALTGRGVACHVMHGNRDFLLGEGFAATTGCRLLGDYETIDVHGTAVLLTHGDLLCTDDRDYMALRATVRAAAWQDEFLAKPLAERRAIAAAMRAKSRSEIAAKPEDIMDVNQATVEDTMRRFGVRHLLHGHTHRPAVHEFTLDGHDATRIVLGDWHEHGSVVRWDEHGFALEMVAG